MAQPPKGRNRPSLDDILNEPSRPSLDDILGAPPVNLAEQEAQSVERIAQNPRQARNVLRAAGQGLPFVGTGLDEAEAFVESLRTGRPYSEVARRINKEMRQFQSEQPLMAYGTELASGLATGGIASRFAKGGVKKALESGATQGFFAGFGAGEGGLAERAVSGLTGLATGAATSSFLTPKAKVTQRDVPRDVAAVVGGLGQNVRVGAAESLRNRIAAAGQRAQRSVSDRLAPYAPGVARAIEPTDITKVQRTAEQLFPSNLTVDKLQAQAGRASEAAKSIGEELAATQKRSASLATATKGRVRRISKIGAEQAKREAEDLLAQAEQQGAEIVGTLRSVPNKADQTRETIRQIQLAEGKAGYDEVRRLGPPPEPDTEVYKAIISDPLLRRGYKNAVTAVRRETKTANPAEAALKPLRSVTIGQQSFPEISLEMFDNMRRHVMDQVVVNKAGATGVTASQRRAALETINQLEDRFLQGYGSDAAAQALQGTRAQYRARFEQLEALNDGLSLGRAKAGAKPGLTKPNRMDLDEMTRRVAGYSPEAQEAFKVGAAKWFDNLAQEGLDKDAMTFIRRATATEAGMRRLALAFGENTALQMSALAKAPAAISQRTAATEARAAALAGRAQQQGAQRVTQLQAEAERLGQDLAAQQSRASQLGATASAAQRFRTALGDTEAAQGIVDVVLPSLGNEGLSTMRQYGSAALKRELEGLTLDQARRKIAELQANPAAQRLFGQELMQLGRAAQPGPRVVRPALARALGAASGNTLTGLFSTTRERQ
jgi:hypothetical protein